MASENAKKTWQDKTPGHGRFIVVTQLSADRSKVLSKERIQLPPGISVIRDARGNTLYNVDFFKPPTLELLKLSKRNNMHVGNTTNTTANHFSFPDFLIDMHQAHAIRAIGLDIGKYSKRFEHKFSVL